MSTQTQLRPLGDRVIVEPIPEHERGSETKSGIYIPETVDKERAEQGKVIAVGPGKRNDQGNLMPMQVKVGDVVLFTKYGPDQVKLGNQEFTILSENNILAVVEGTGSAGVQN